MADHRDWPPRSAELHAAARSLAYLMYAVMGVEVSYGMSPPDFGFSVFPLGVFAAVSGVIALVGTIFRRWKVELVAVYAMTGMTFGYTVIDWLNLIFNVGYPPLTMTLLAVGAGILVVAAVATGRNRWRWAALLAAGVVLALAAPLGARNTAALTVITCLFFARCVELNAFKRMTIAAATAVSTVQCAQPDT